VNGSPAISTSLRRALFPVFGSISNAIVAELRPAGVMTRIQEALDAVRQSHPSRVVSATEVLPPLCGAEADERFNSNRHGAAACETLTRESLSITEPARTIAVGFSATVTVSVPSP
jgi:hypothetical protein